MRLIALVLAVLTLASAYAGCITAPGDESPAATASVPRFDASKTELVRLALKTKDGVSLDIVANLSADAKAAGEKLPVIVDIGPYYGANIMKYSAIDARMAEYFVPRGYVMARASLRGTGYSDGCFDLGGKVEQQDVHDIVEFLGEQPWSNGNVAVFGKSYDGTTPWEAAITQPSHLKTIVPISGISDMYRYTFYDGTVYPEEVAFEPYYYLFVDDDLSIPGPDGGAPAWSGDPAMLQKNLVRTCDGLVPQSKGDLQSTVTGDHGDPFWTERDYERSWDKIQVPVFLVHGMQDWNVKPDHEVPLFNALKGPKAAWFGQWNHDYPDINHYKPEWSRHDWNETLLVWFDHWLKNVDNDWQRVAHVEAQDNVGTWTTYAAWPPADAVPLDLSPRTGGALGASKDGASLVTLSDPTGSGFDPKSKTGGLAFVTAPMPTDVTLLGRASLDVHLTIDRPGGNVVAKLYDVSENGTWTELDHGMRELRHAKTRESGEPAPMLTKFNTTLWFYPQEIVLAKGHALALVLALEAPDWIVRSPFLLAQASVHIGKGATTLHILAANAEDASAMRDATGATSARENDILAREIMK
jgi:X-Pro dipeptidyl-peptidase